jgi:CheY-like chemotaxis protein
VLLVEDNYETRLIYEKYLRTSPWKAVSARSVREAENVLRNLQPAAIVLDIMLEGEDSWAFLARLKSDSATRSIPILVATTVDDRSKAMALGADLYAVKPIGSQALLDALTKLITPEKPKTVLLVDDEEVSRYLLKQLFGNPEVRFLEAVNGLQGVELARTEKPDLVMMDLMMPEMNGFQAIEKMASEADLRDIPVIVSTSRILSDDQIAVIAGRVLGIISKESLSTHGVDSRLHDLLAAAGLEDLQAKWDDSPKLAAT